MKNDKPFLVKKNITVEYENISKLGCTWTCKFFLYKVIYTFIDKGYDDRLQRTGLLGL